MSDQPLREHLVYLLAGGGAHVGFERAIADFPAKLRGSRPEAIPHSPWRLLEHMRIAQWDILQFSRNAKHVSPEFPQGYWPESDAPPDSGAWDASVRRFLVDLKAMQDLVADASVDLFVPIPHGDGANDSARSAARGRSQCLAHRPTRDRPPRAGRVAGMTRLRPRRHGRTQS